jgi:hypothetical protein
MASEAPDRVHNDHNVYILGAGFSYAAAGIPPVDGFMRAMTEAPEWLATQFDREAEIDAIRTVLDFRRKAASAGYRVNLRLEDVEELFSLASVTEGGALADDVIRAISATIDYAQNEAIPSGFQVWCGGGPWTPPSAWKQVPGVTPRAYQCSGGDFYVALMVGGAGLNQRTPERRDTVITFNYDLTIEHALEALGLCCTYGFGGEEADFDAGVCRPEPDPNAALRILKLHGSVNWARPEEPHGKLAIRRSYDDVRRLKTVPALVPPTWQKSFGDVLLPAWNAAIKELSTTTRVIIAGYSVPETDLHFKYLLAAGLQDNISLRTILFVNQEADALKGKLLKILRQELIDWKVLGSVNKTIETFFSDSTDRHRINRDIPTNLPTTLGAGLFRQAVLPKLHARPA